MAIAVKAHASITSQWHRQIFRNRSPKTVAARSPFVAASYIAQDCTRSGFVDINRLLIVLLYEDVVRTDYSPTGNQSPLRFAGYRVTQVPHGVCWGGAANSQFFKDLTLTPRPGGRHQRLDCAKTRMVELARKMDRRLARAGSARVRHGLACGCHACGPDFVHPVLTNFVATGRNSKRLVAMPVVLQRPLFKDHGACCVASLCTLWSGSAAN